MDTCAAAVRALVLSRLDYANSLLYDVPDCALEKLQVLQNNAARLVSRCPRRGHITPVLRQLHWLPIRQRISHTLLSLAHRAVHDESTPLYLQELIQPKRAPRALRSKSAALQLHAPRTTKRIGDRAFSVGAPREWNALPPDTRCVDSYASFKKCVKTILFRQHFG